MKSKLALLLATLLFFNIILPVRVSAASFQDQSKPIFGLTADQVVEKYNQLTDQQKVQVLRSLGNTSIFANSLFGNIFNSTFGVLDDAVKKLGDLFFQANGVIYKLGSSALAWVSRLIDKVFNNDLNDINISQPVIDDFYLYTRNLLYVQAPLFVNKHCPNYVSNLQQRFNDTLDTYPSDVGLVYLSTYNASNSWQYILYGCSRSNLADSYKFFRLIVDDDNKQIYVGYYSLVDLGNGLYRPNRYSTDGLPSSSRFPCYIQGFYSWNVVGYALNIYDSSVSSWHNVNSSVLAVTPLYSYTGDYHSALRFYLDEYISTCDEYIYIKDNYASYVQINHLPEYVDVTNNSYFNYIYNIPVQTPLNITNIVSNTAINYNPIDNIAYYLPDQYDIEQNFTVVNNYYISSGSSISGQAIDVNLVSPGVIDVRITNPEDISQEVTNNISKDLILNFNLNSGDLVLEPKLEVSLNQNLNSIKPEVTSSGGIVTGFAGGIPPDLFKIVCVLFGISLLVACLYHGSN